MNSEGVFIIAEAGVNHNGDIALAYKLIDAALECGVDAIKFQTYKAENLISMYAEKAEYQKLATGNIETQLEMLKKLELSFNDFRCLKNYCDSKNITFLSTPFDIESAVFLQSLNIEIFKIPSGEITNLLLLEIIGEFDKKVILSTGMATLSEIEAAIKVLRDKGSRDITVLHCNTEYPTPMKDVNLKAMLTIKEKLNVPIGYSDHTLGIEVPIAAVAMGAKIIEKHFTLDKTMEGPDHRASLDPIELKDMVMAIRNIEESLGTGLKEPSLSEVKNMAVARKSIVARKKILRGEPFTRDNITVKRPGTGISPMRWYEVINTVADRDYDGDELIVI